MPRHNKLANLHVQNGMYPAKTKISIHAGCSSDSHRPKALYWFDQVHWSPGLCWCAGWSESLGPCHFIGFSCVLAHLSRDMTKPSKWHVCPANSDQPVHLPRLIRVFSVRLKEAWVLSYPLSRKWRLIWSESSLGAHNFVWFCHETAHLEHAGLQNLI